MMRIILIFLFVGNLFTLNTTTAQLNSKIDSLERLLPDLTELDRLNALLQLSKAHGGNNSNRMLEYASQAYELSQKTDHQYNLGDALLLKARAVSLMDNQHLCLSFLHSADSIFSIQQSVSGKLKVTVQKGVANRCLGNLIEAKSIVQEGLQMARKSNEVTLQMQLLLDLAETELKQGLARDAEKHLTEARFLNSKVKLPQLSAKLELGTGKVFSLLGNSKLARMHYEAALMFAENSSDQQLLGSCYLFLAELEMLEVNYTQVRTLLTMLDSIVEKTGSKRLSMETDRMKAIFNSISGHTERSNLLFKKVHKQSRDLKDKQRLNSISGSLASILINTSSNLEEALERCFDGLKESKRKHYFLNETYWLAIIGKFYSRNGEEVKAQQYYVQGLKLARKLELNASIIRILKRQEVFFTKKGKMEKSISNYMEVLDLALRSGNKREIVRARSRLATLYYFNRDRDKCIQFISKSLEMQDVLNQNKGLAVHTYKQAGQIYRQINPEKSILYFKKCLALNETAKFSTTNLNCYYFLSRIYEDKGNYREALKYQKKLYDLESAINENKQNKEIALVKTKYETELKDNKILVIENEKALQALKLANQKSEIAAQQQYLVLLFLIALFVLGLGVFFFNRYRLRQKNEKLSMHNEQLELEHKQEKTKQQLEIAEFRSKFFTNVSHELRTPLTLILGPLEKLLQQEQLEYRNDITRINKNATRLLELVNQTLDLSKLENGHRPLKLERLKLADLMGKILQSFQSLSETQRVKLKLRDETKGCEVNVDKEKLEKIMVNLLGNAFNHTIGGNEIVVSICIQNDETISIHVQDTGKGIAAEHLPYLFDRFYQVESGVDKGSGIGLALTKELVELHNGTISVQSSKGEGSTFSVKLPLQQNEISNHLEANTEGQFNLDQKSNNITINGDTRSKTVLIIEDHEEVRQYLKEMLQESYTILEAEDGEKGIALAEKYYPDLIISDIMMPYKDGLELTNHLKGDIHTSHIPIILLTAKATIENKIEGLKTGADDYLTKPFNATELIHRCKNLITQRQNLRELFSKNVFIPPKKIVTNGLDETFLNKANELIEKYASDPEFTVAKLSYHLSLNRNSVHQKLKALTGMSPQNFIRSIRMKKAAELLDQTQLPVIEVAERVGYSTRQAFNKAFKAQFEMNPTAYQNR